MSWLLLRRKTGKPRFGALFWVALLLLSSAVLRLGFEAGAAIAREQVEPGTEMRDQELEAQNVLPGPTEAELEKVLRVMQDREMALVTREKQIEDRMKALEIAEAAIEKKLAALVEAESALRDTVALADGASEQDLSRLTAVYDKMKPKEAAALFEAMDPTFAAGFLARMKPESAAGILSKVDPDAAYTISVILAGRNTLVPKE